MKRVNHLNFINAIFQIGFIGLALASCNPSPKTLFELLPSNKTGIEFSNTILESDSFNIFDYDYIYNGGGVAVADFNNDGLQDIFFTGNMVPNKLYLNNGEMKFADVSDEAKVNVKGRWNTGVVVVDINNDGWQDIYVCATKHKDSANRANMLFVNKGIGKGNVPVFDEVAAQYGIADNGHSLMAAFLDYDRDGDLDLYVLTNMHAVTVSSNYRPKINDGSAVTNDRLYRNNGNGTFTNVTKEAGIVYEGFGLGLAIADLNLDGWPDIYVSNDFITNDLLYINNQDGTFSNKIAQKIGHQSQSSMGNDVADYNNDGLPDIVTMDMLPETNERKKTSINNKSYLTYINNETFHYEPQYMRNMLQLNNGLNDNVGFSEVGELAGVFQTEWSWSPLFADFDNDGLKDLLITNGFPKDITDKDFVAYREDVGNYVSNAKLLDSVPVVKIPNYAYKNKGDLTFKDVSKEWGIVQPSFSNGAAFADFDNDGDLDYVVNNINDKAFLYKNTLYSKDNKSEVNFLRVKLSGAAFNKGAVGATVTLYHDHGKKQYFEEELARGYLSSVESIIHIGMGKSQQADSIRIRWPDGKEQKLENIKVNQVLSVAYDPSIVKQPAKTGIKKSLLLQEASIKTKLLFKHQEEDKIDFNIQRTLPHKFSQSGPGICIGDINGDHLEDVVIGGSSGHPTIFYTQKSDGAFSGQKVIPGSETKMEEDEGLLLFDADGDNDLDLYVVSGSMEVQPPSKYYQDKLYKNDGKGNFTLDIQALPPISASGSCVRAADFDGDNDLDLFVGGRVVPGSYPLPAESYLLKNENGKFINVTSSSCPDLVNLGMITDALFTDFDNDGNIDLVIVGEFMPITFFKNSAGKFTKVSSTGLEEFSGWWNSITGGDFDNDGDVDYVAGNLGLNNGYQASKEFPLSVYASDFDKNGSVDAILACYIKESLKNDEKKLYPVHFWDEINSQSPRFRQQFNRYKHYGKATLNGLLTPEEMKGAYMRQANHFETSYIENLGNGKFKLTALPTLVQVSPVNGMITNDVNEDGNLDVILVGNDFGNEVFFGRYDAFTGLILLGNGKGSFEVIPSAKSGFLVNGDAKSLARLSSVKGDVFIATQNRDSLKVFTKTIEKNTSEFQPKSLDTWAELIYDDGKKQRLEFYYGSGYLSQSTRKLRVPKGVKEISVHDTKGQSRKIGSGI